MSDLLVFDMYTATVFGVIGAGGCLLALVIFLSRKFPRQAEMVGNLSLTLAFLLILSFCSLQIAQLQRDAAKYDHSKDAAP